jgi:hypothetical protein
MVDNLPLDIQKEWFSVVRRLQSVAKSNGLSLVSITVLCDQDGKPLFWLSPEKKLIEPKSQAEDLIKLLTSR